MIRIITTVLLVTFQAFAYKSAFDTVKVNKMILGRGDTSSAPVALPVWDAVGDTLRCMPFDSLDIDTTVVAAGSGITVVHSNDTFIVSLYEPPDITTYTNTEATHYAGQTVTGLTTNWTLTGASITGQTHTDVSPDPDIADRSHVFTGLSLITDKTYKLRVTDGVTPDSAYTYVRFYISTFYGTSANSAPTETDIEAGTTTSETQSAVNRALSSTAVTGGGNYIFYAYPASWGNVQIYVNGFATTWIKTTVSVTNAYGDTRDYYVYTSPTTIIGLIYLSAVAS